MRPLGSHPSPLEITRYERACAMLRMVAELENGRANVTLNLKSEGGEVADGGRLRHADRTPSSGLKLNEGISR
jgi:hypothetical protein